MKIVKGWRKIDNHRGYKCDNRAKSYCPKKQYGEHPWDCCLLRQKMMIKEEKYHRSFRPNEKRNHLLWIG
jgi:hypothetical protein